MRVSRFCRLCTCPAYHSIGSGFCFYYFSSLRVVLSPPYLFFWTDTNLRIPFAADTPRGSSIAGVCVTSCSAAADRLNYVRNTHCVTSLLCEDRVLVSGSALDLFGLPPSLVWPTSLSLSSSCFLALNGWLGRVRTEARILTSGNTDGSFG